jgi:hypothetical protein
MQLRREEDGPWLPANQSTSYAASSASTSTNTAAAASGTAASASTGADAATGGSESDILKKLMERREKE